MKKVLLFITLCVMSISGNAQNSEGNEKPHEVYCRIICQGINYKGFLWPEFEKYTKLTDDKGKELKFKNIMETMNYLSKRGWTYVDNHTLDAGWKTYIFKKIVVNDKEAREGLHFEEDF